VPFPIGGGPLQGAQGCAEGVPRVCRGGVAVPGGAGAGGPAWGGRVAEWRPCWWCWLAWKPNCPLNERKGHSEYGVLSPPVTRHTQESTAVLFTRQPPLSLTQGRWCQHPGGSCRERVDISLLSHWWLPPLHCPAKNFNGHVKSLDIAQNVEKRSPALAPTPQKRSEQSEPSEPSICGSLTRLSEPLGKGEGGHASA